MTLARHEHSEYERFEEPWWHEHDGEVHLHPMAESAAGRVNAWAASDARPIDEFGFASVEEAVSAVAAEALAGRPALDAPAVLGMVLAAHDSDHGPAAQPRDGCWMCAWLERFGNRVGLHL